MNSVEKIQDAGTKVAEMQDVLATLQSGLERAEAVAIAAEEAKQRSETGLKVAAGLIVVSFVLLVLSVRKNRS